MTAVRQNMFFQFRVRVAALVLLALSPQLSVSRDAQFTFEASVDRDSISLDETVTLRLELNADGSQNPSGQPDFSANDFVVENQMQDQRIDSYYENGHFGMRSSLRYSFVLRPKRAGKLSIDSIQVNIDGKILKAPTISVEVSAAGPGTGPPRNYGGSTGLRGAGRNTDLRPVFVRAEVNKSRAYKGEQVIVSYYLYQRARAFNMQPIQYPMFEGFLKDDLEVPVQTGNLYWERTNLDGVSYQRALLARYAVYPLKEGKLKTGILGIRANYFAQARPLTDDDDDEGLLGAFMQQLSPRVVDSQSVPVTIEVQNLPPEGAGEKFSGGVGDFDVISTTDRYELKTGESLNLTVKLEGRGNLSNVKFPDVDWPKSLEPYENKSRVSGGHGGVSQKLFEFLFIPREPGQTTIPSISFLFFDPLKGQYVEKRTEPILIQVQPGAPGSEVPRAAPAPRATPSAGAASPPPTQKLEPRSLDENPKIFGALESLRLILPYLLGLLTLVLGALVGFAAWRKGAAQKTVDLEAKVIREREKRWQTLDLVAERLALQGSWSEIQDWARQLDERVHVELEVLAGKSVLGYGREMLRDELLNSNSLSQKRWENLDAGLDALQFILFSGSPPAPVQGQIRSKLKETLGLLKKSLDSISEKGPRAPIKK